MELNFIGSILFLVIKFLRFNQNKQMSYIHAIPKTFSEPTFSEVESKGSQTVLEPFVNNIDQYDHDISFLHWRENLLSKKCNKPRVLNCVITIFAHSKFILKK